MFFDKDFVNAETDYRRGQLKSDYSKANRPSGGLVRGVVLRSAIAIGIVAVMIFGLGDRDGQSPVDSSTEVVYQVGSGPNRVK